MKILKIISLSLSIAGCATVTKEELNNLEAKTNVKLLELHKKACLQETAWCILGSNGSADMCDAYNRACNIKAYKDLGIKFSNDEGK